MLDPYLFKMKPYPLRMLVDIHAFCNARCGMCSYPKYAKTQSQEHMPWNAYTIIVDEFSQRGNQYNFTPLLSYCYMGEVFLENHVDKYVQYATDQNIDVYLNTNAHVMTREKVDALLATSFNGDFYISSHTHNPKTYKRITGLEYQQTLDNILYLIDHNDPGKVLIRGVDDRWKPRDKES